MKFTDLDFDCLETVLVYLELIDLLNVADSTKRLNKAAELVFARKYRNKTVGIRGTRILRDRSFKICYGFFDINDLKTALQLLRCFGPVISKIRLGSMLGTNAGNLPEIDSNVFIYINKYCADYLAKLEIEQIRYERGDLLTYFDRPFQRLRTFESLDLVFSENICLNTLFPKMWDLCIWNFSSKYPNTSFYNINTKHFPFLEILTITDNVHRDSSIRNEMLINMLQMNPQLKFLYISLSSESDSLNTDLIRNAVDSLQNVEDLSLSLNPITFLDDTDNIIQMKSVKSFFISFPRHSFDDSSYFLPFSFEKLEQFRITFPDVQFRNGSFNDQLFNFIDLHLSIKDIIIDNIESDVVDWSRLAKSLPLLRMINILSFISADEAIEIMSKFQMLNKFRFKFSDDYDEFRKRLDKNWERASGTGSLIVQLNRKI